MSYKQYYIYIMTNYENTTLYTGVTNDLLRRVYEHKNKLLEGFTSRYNFNSLVYYEIYDEIEQAIIREKQIKKWSRKRKTDLIKSFNSDWIDLSASWTDCHIEPTQSMAGIRLSSQ